jgi:hypothetical protein
MSGLVHPDQNVRNATQNSLCRAVNRRRGCCACRASNCRRRARFSRTRSSRERKALTIQPRKCRSDASIAGIISEKSESSFAPSHSFCRCTRFWRGTTTSERRRRRRGKDSESCLAISHIYKDVCGLAQAKGLPSLIYHESVLEVRFMRGAAGTTRILTIRSREPRPSVGVSLRSRTTHRARGADIC